MSPSHPRRFAQIVRLKPEYLAEYKRIHAAVWPGVLRAIKAANIADYSIFYDDSSSTLFASFKYVGEDFEGDMRRMSEDEEVRRWWKVTDEMQESLVEGAKSSQEGEWWKRLEEVFYLE
ncbi:hypothetical protein VTO42DRAFT_3091 [Malbranchea cinnamomea]